MGPQLHIETVTTQIKVSEGGREIVCKGGGGGVATINNCCQAERRELCLCKHQKSYVRQNCSCDIRERGTERECENETERQRQGETMNDKLMIAIGLKI